MLTMTDQNILAQDEVIPEKTHLSDEAEERLGSLETETKVGPETNGMRVLHRILIVPDIKKDPSGKTAQYIATGIVNLGAFAAGQCVAWSSAALPLMTVKTGTSDPSLQDTLHSRVTLSASEPSWVAALLCLGACFGAVPAGLISEHFGRKKTLLYLALPMIVSWLLIASSPNVYGLYVGRFIGGVAIGAFSVSIPPYVEDIAEKFRLRGLANFYHLYFSCGILFGYIIGSIGSLVWYCVLCSAIPVAFFIAFSLIPESPTYLVSQGKFIEAEAALRYYRGIDNDVNLEISAKKEYMRNYAKHKVTFKELFSTKTTVKALVVSFGLMVFQQMSGIYPVLFYAAQIFATFSHTTSSTGDAIILGCWLVLSTYVSSILLQRIKRRILLILSFLSMAGGLGGLAIYYHLKASYLSAEHAWISLVALCWFVSWYAVGVGPIPWLMLREIFPPNVTRRATAIAAGVHWFLAFVVMKIYQNLVDSLMLGWALWHFAVTCVIASVFVYFFVPETKGRTLDEIQSEFEGIHRKKHTHVIEIECVSEC